MPRISRDDQRIYLRLGLAISKAQLLEVALVKLVEAQRQDLSLPLDDRWAEIATWLGMTAGRLQRLLGVPEVVASDVRAAIGRRNRVAHDAWMLYSVASNSRASADTWAPWLEAEAAMLQQVVHGLARLRDCVEQLRTRGELVDDADLLRVWRNYVPEAIAPRPDREPGT
jgi:hypothetical protein